MTKVIEEIAAERKRQIDVEKFDITHDDRENDSGGLACAAATYAANVAADLMLEENILAPRIKAVVQWLWPWHPKWWKPKSPRRDLIRAAALIVAEIERLDRQHSL